jgi:fibronectin-binding autotransporter adhesin
MVSLQRRQFVHARWATTFRWAILCLVLAAMLSPLGLSARADQFYWTGNSAGGPIWNSTIGGTNWSTDPNTLADPAAFPTSASDVFFVFAPEKNPTTTLGANFSIKGLTFTSDATAPVTIGGANTLTIGVNGVTLNSPASDTISANVALGAAQTWSNNSPSATTLTVSGQISGSTALTLRGTGSTTSPSGSFVFTGNNTYSGALTLLNANTSLTLSGNGRLASVSGINLGGGAGLTLDNGTVAATRLTGTMPVTSTGGTLSLLGNASSVVSDSIGALTVGSGATNINVTSAGQTTTLTINGLSRTVGGTINFSPTSGTAVIAAPSLPAGLIGPWASIGAEDNTGSLDFATVAGGVVTPLSTYNTGAFNTWGATDNVKVSNTQTLTANQTVGTVSVTTAGILSLNGRTLTVGAGGIIANGGTGTYAVNGNQTMNKAMVLGGTAFSAGSTRFVANSTIRTALGVPDLVFNVSGDSTLVAGSPNTSTGVLQTSAIISDSAPLAGTFTASTTTGSNIVTLTAGDTSQLTGLAVTGLAGFPALPNSPPAITGIIDATHFTVGSNATAGGSSTPSFVSRTTVIKTGNGILDLADGNNTTITSTYSGGLVVNGGTVLVRNDANFGAVPAAYVPNSITLNGGEIRTTATFDLNANRGVTVGTGGGTFSYTGGSLVRINAPIIGNGNITLRALSTATGGSGPNLVLNNANTTPNSYTGTTTLIATLNSANISGQQNAGAGIVRWGLSNQIPDLSAVTLTTVTAGGTALGVPRIDMNGQSDTIGSLAGNALVEKFNGALTTGGNNLSTTFSGSFTDTFFPTADGHGGYTLGTPGSGSFTKVGSGTQTLSGVNNYVGATNVNSGTLLVTGSLSTTPVTVNSGGALGGSGTIAGPVTIANGGALAPAVTSTGASTLQLTSGLTLNGGSLLNFNLGAINIGPDPILAPTSDNVFVTGALTIGSGTDSINLTSIGSGIVPGIYKLITASSVPASLSGTNFNVSGPLQFLYSVVTDTVGNSLNLVVSNNPNPSLTWVGAPGNGTWDLNAANKPWVLTGGGSSSAYSNGALLTFDNASGGNATISIPANVSPGSLTFNNNSLANYTFNGAGQITGTTGLLKKNNGTVTFNNPNTFTGNTTINGGTVQVGSTYSSPLVTVSGSGANFTVLVGGVLPSTSSLKVNNAGTATFNSPSQTLTGVNTDATSSLVLNGTALTITDVGSLAAPIVGTGSLAVRTGVTTLASSSNSYSGGTSVAQGGTLINGANNALPPNTSLVMGDAGNTAATWDLGGFSDRIVNLVSVGAGPLTILDTAAAGNQTLTFNNDAATSNVDITFNGTINESTTTTPTNTLGITKNGSRLLILGAANTFHGPTTINGGAVRLNDGNALFNSTVIVNINNGVRFGAGFGFFSFAGLAGTGDVALLDTGSNPVALSFGANNQDNTYSGKLSGAGGTLFKSGTGTQTFSGANTYDGGTTITAGNFNISNSTAFGTGPVLMTTANSTIRLSGGINAANALTILGPGPDTNGALSSTTGTNTWSGPITLGDANTRVGAGPGATLVLSGPITGSGNGLIVRTADQTGTVVLSNAGNSWGAPTQLIFGTTQIAGGDDRLATSQPLQLGNNSAINVTFDLNGFNQTVAGLQDRPGQSVATAFVTNSAPATTSKITSTGNIAGNSTYGGLIQNGTSGGVVAFAMNGPGNTQILRGANTYTGGTTITAGTLAVTNTTGSATGTGPVVVSAAGTLAGTGRIAGAVTLNGTLAPGIGPNGLGTITLGGDTATTTTLNAGSSLAYDFLSGLAFDSAHATGPLQIGGTVNVNLNLISNLAPGSYTLLTSTGITNTGTPSFPITGGNPNASYVVAEQGNNLVLTVTAQTQTWKGTNGNAWDLSTANWDPAVHSGVYQDNVYQQRFDDSGANTNINIPAQVAPLAVLFANNSVPYTISGAPISGGTGVVIQGPGTVTLNSSNTYTGGTTLSGGTLKLGDPGAIGTGPLGISGGTIDNTTGGPTTLTNNNAQIWAGNFTVAGTADGTHDLNFGTGAVTLNSNSTMNVPAGTVTVGGAIGDGGNGLGITKAGAGTLVLAGVSSYSGSTTVTGGVLSIAADNNLGAAPGAAQPAGITLNGGTLSVTAGTAANLAAGNATINTNRGITLGASGGTINIGFVTPTLTLGSETALVYNGVISGPGGLTVTGQAGIDQSSQSILNLGAIATYQGNTTISNAIVQVNSGTTGANNGAAVVNVLPTTTVLNLVNNGAWNIDSTASNLTVAGLTGDATGRFGTSNQTTAGTNLTLSGSGTYTFPGVIGAITVAGKTGTNTIFSLTKNGTGTQILTGVNTYTDRTTINQGTLSLGIANGLASASPLVLGGGRLATGGFNQSMNTLTLSASSAIDLGTGASVFNFADSHLATWTASGTLTIGHWSGNVGVGGGADQLIFGIDNTGLTSTQVGQIHFQGFTGTTILANGEVVALAADPTHLPGDWDLNSVVNAADVKAMLSALTNLSAYKSAHGLSDENLLNIGDLDYSGSVNNFDIQPELAYIATGVLGGGSLAAVPEPATLVLLAIGVVISALAAPGRDRAARHAADDRVL